MKKAQQPTPHHETWGFLWSIVIVALALLIVVFAVSGAFAASWPLKAIARERANAIIMRHYIGTLPTGQSATCIDCDSLSYNFNALDDQYNQVVVFYEYPGMDYAVCQTFWWNRKTSFSASDRVTLNGMRWGEQAYSARLIHTTDYVDTVFNRYRLLGTTSASYKWDTAVSVVPGKVNKYELQLVYDQGDLPATTSLVLDVRRDTTQTAQFPWPVQPGLTTLFLQYSRNGSPYRGATLIVTNPKIAYDTSTGQIIGPFRKTGVTNFLGVTGVQVVPSTLYHDSLKSLYTIGLYAGGAKVKEWTDYYIPSQDTVRLRVED